MLVRGRDLGRTRGSIEMVMLNKNNARKDHEMSCITKDRRGECRIDRRTPSRISLGSKPNINHEVIIRLVNFA